MYWLEKIRTLPQPLPTWLTKSYLTEPVNNTSILFVQEEYLHLLSNTYYLSKLVIQSLKDGMTTSEIDDLSAETAAYMSTYEPDYDTLAARISISNHHKSTSSSFYEAMKSLYEYINPKTDKQCNIISSEFMNFVERHSQVLDSMIDYLRDYNYSYFGFKTLQRLYVKKINNKYIERPQHMIMRVAVSIHAINTKDEQDIILNNIKIKWWF